jgi:hypothetical protein
VKALGSARKYSVQVPTARQFRQLSLRHSLGLKVLFVLIGSASAAAAAVFGWR